MEGVIDAGYDYLEPLLECRDWLAKIRNDRSMRSAVRRDGRPKFMSNGALIPGPFMMEVRREILDRLLAVQAELQKDEKRRDLTLISEDEIQTIKLLWARDALAAGHRALEIAQPQEKDEQRCESASSDHTTPAPVCRGMKPR